MDRPGVADQRLRLSFTVADQLDLVCSAISSPAHKLAGRGVAPCKRC